MQGPAAKEGRRAAEAEQRSTSPSCALRRQEEDDDESTTGEGTSGRSGRWRARGGEGDRPGRSTKAPRPCPPARFGTSAAQRARGGLAALRGGRGVAWFRWTGSASGEQQISVPRDKAVNAWFWLVGWLKRSTTETPNFGHTGSSTTSTRSDLDGWAHHACHHDDLARSRHSTVKKEKKKCCLDWSLDSDSDCYRIVIQLGHGRGTVKETTLFSHVY